MGWRDILRSPDPSRALYLAMRANPTASRAADVFQGGFEGVVGGAIEGAGRFANALAIPARAIAAAAGNTAGTGARPVDVSDYALYGRDMETGLQATQYGDLLAGTMEDAGEIEPGGKVSTLLRLAGNAVTDPAMAPALLSGAEAIGALGGAMTPSAPAMTPSRAYRPMSSPTRPPPPPPRIGTPPPQGPIPLTTSPPPGPGQPGGPVRPPGVTAVPQGPGPGPTATQRVPVHLQGTGQGPVGMSTQPVSTFNPTATQPVPFNPTATQRTPMTRGPGGRGHLRPKAQRKPPLKSKSSKEE
jgi:hypothetical protein